MDSNIAMLGALGALIALVVAVGVVFMQMVRSEQSKQEPKTREATGDEGTSAGGRRRNRMGAGGLRRRQQQASTSAADSDRGGSEEEEEEEEDEATLNKKEKAKRAKEAAREAERIARELKEGKKSAYAEKQRKKEEEREAKEKAQEEEMKRAEEERQAKEDEEAAKWMSMISVDTSGTEEAEAQQESGGLLAQFVDYIRGRKTVPLEQLAVEFKLRTTDVIDRIHGLEAMGRLTGVMDERGKYIYISEEEMVAVAKYITQKGRVGISELATKSNEFIDLEAKATDIGASAERPTIDFDSLVD